MLITPDFVFVHMPKTGGSFVVRMLQMVYGDRASEYGHKHATCEEIPSSEHGKPILSVVRSPWDRYVSQYHYGWWKTHPEAYCDTTPILREHPTYPQVGFDAFVRIANAHFVNAHRGVATGFVNTRLPAEHAPGWHTEQFIRFFCRSPREAFAAIGAAERETGRLPDHEYPVRFLQTERLNRDLSLALRDCLGDAPQALALRARIEEHAPVLPDQAYEQRHDRATSHYYDPALIDFVRQREAFLFGRFPHYQEVAA
jgi:hypothetical protein